MNKLIDTHAHICSSEFDDDRPQVLQSADTAGVGAIVCVGEDLADAHKNLALAQSHPICKPAAGLYPTHLDPAQADRMIAFIRANHEKLVAIGEVGLDYWVIKEDDAKQLQKEIFKRFIALSNELDLPLNVHSRSAGRHAIDLLLAAGARHVQMHAFDGKSAAALPGVEAGYLFSIPPSVVRSRQKQKLVKQLPMSCLLAETDSPVLGPEPGLRNEPANITIVVETIAQIKNLPKEAVVDALVANGRRLYGSTLNPAIIMN